ncbi:uncharacterized protein B0J16DRAFT_325401 [Fusarium flagelliforme]|uniref:uncharacterized protein n=1 Tax=Fusarium flagelliforme TaxID=2675880 RepID=UPI001E8D7906|nr:uncharacterized protein B0J16DRAFT_325401 [Fusarium flagelliforme]KAH7173921.1 hypothetical protein B0J16DRAFT_325401 [Fusarium flagelliforme]
MSCEDLFTKYSKVAANWALQYFDVEQFDTARSSELSADFLPIEGISPARRKEYDQSFQTPGPSNGAVTWSFPNVRSFGSDPRSQRPSATRHSSDNAAATASSPSASRSTGRSNSYSLRLGQPSRSARRHEIRFVVVYRFAFPSPDEDAVTSLGGTLTPSAEMPCASIPLMLARLSRPDFQHDELKFDRFFINATSAERPVLGGLLLVSQQGSEGRPVVQLMDVDVHSLAAKKGKRSIRCWGYHLRGIDNLGTPRNTLVVVDSLLGTVVPKGDCCFEECHLVRSYGFVDVVDDKEVFDN